MSRAANCRYDTFCLHDDVADVSFHTARYEGYGPGGAAVIVDCFTDNRDRTAAKLRQVFAVNGGNLGAPDSVAYLFKSVGRMTYPQGTDAEVLRRLALDIGAEDFVTTSSGSIEVLTDPLELDALQARLCAEGFVPAMVDVTERASIAVPLAGALAESMQRLLKALWQLDDVRHVYSNAEIPREFLASL